MTASTPTDLDVLSEAIRLDALAAVERGQPAEAVGGHVQIFTAEMAGLIRASYTLTEAGAEVLGRARERGVPVDRLGEMLRGGMADR
jgi:hypothetical protein